MMMISPERRRLMKMDLLRNHERDDRMTMMTNQEQRSDELRMMMRMRDPRKRKLSE